MSDDPKVNVPAADDVTSIAKRMKEIAADEGRARAEADRLRALEDPTKPPGYGGF